MNPCPEPSNKTPAPGRTSIPTLQHRRSGAAFDFSHPDDVLNSVRLMKSEKRAILASWISDARAVEGTPALRELENGTIVHVDDVMHALKSLDSNEGLVVDHRHGPLSPPPFARRTRVGLPWSVYRARRRNNRDDDDDPPPCLTAGVVALHGSFAIA
jgi:hypothetical protein